MNTTKAIITSALLSLILAVSTQAAILTEYYNNQPVGGLPQPQVSFTLGTDWTLTLSPDSLYAQNTGFNAGTSYRTLYGDGNNLLFKFNRVEGDTNAYDVTVNLSGFNQWNGEGSSSLQLLWGTDEFGIQDNEFSNRGGVWWQGDTAYLTQVASNTAGGGFTWNSTPFRIGADQQSAYLVFLGSANSYGYVYSASADFTAVPEPSTYALVLGGIATLLLIRRRVQA
jgi:hypothetical protein